MNRGSTNKGFFEHTLFPLDSEPPQVPTGVARLLASEAAHLTDLERLPVQDEED